MTHWYEMLFANFAKRCDKECFTQGTVGGVDFFERELGGDWSKRILDIACGTGRHAIELTFDLLTFRNRADVTFTDGAGLSQTIHTDERFYTPAEVCWLPSTAGFASVAPYGCHIGQFSREHELTTDGLEMLVVAEKGKGRSAE